VNLLASPRGACLIESQPLRRQDGGFVDPKFRRGFVYPADGESPDAAFDETYAELCAQLGIRYAPLFFEYRTAVSFCASDDDTCTLTKHLPPPPTTATTTTTTTAAAGLTLTKRTLGCVRNSVYGTRHSS